MPDYIDYQVKGGIAHLTFNKPERLNALNAAAISEFTQVVQGLAQASDIHVVILTGSGKAFIAGADIKAMSAMDATHAWEFAHAGQELLTMLENLPQVTIAAVNGFALGGGCEVALACDLIYAAEKARFGQPEVSLGIIPGFGGSVRLLRRIGFGNAKEWIVRGMQVDAVQAHAMGLVQAVFASEQLQAEVQLIAAEILKKSPHAIKLAKQSMRFALDHDVHSSMQYEAELFSQCFTHPDQKEGTLAFVEKRPAKWESQ